MTSSASNITNLSAVRALVDDAETLPSVGEKFPADMAEDFSRDGVQAGQWRPNRLGLPDDCPVIPLGVAGNVCWFIDPIGQIQPLAPPYGKGHILGLFAGWSGYLEWAWPRWNAPKDNVSFQIVGYQAEKAAADLVRACNAKGPWEAVEKVRGRGAWLGEAGDLVVHTGTEVNRGGRTEPPGELGRFVYPTRPPIPGPWPDQVDERLNPATQLMPILRSWQWARPHVDPELLLGWIGAGFLGGALPWRPSVYIMGDKAVGKSTVQSLVKDMMGEWLIQAVDTTPAGLYQHLGNDSLALSIDEFEPGKDTRRAEAVLALMRISASGGMMLRGGDRHNPVQFRARSCFLFSSINIPPMNPADMSRLAVLRLNKLQDDAAALDLDPQSLKVIGRYILRRMMTEWHRFPETYQAFRAELSRGGMDGRAQDTFGTLLACADMIQHEGWSEERVQCATADGDLVPWSELMAVNKMAEFEDMDENWRKCLSHLLGVRVEAWRGGTRHAVGQVLEEFYRPHGQLDLNQARLLLSQAGLALVNRKEKGFWLAVPNNNPLTRMLFDGSDWAGAMGAGVWSGALRQSPRDTIHDVEKARVNGDVLPATLISLEGLYGPEGIMRLPKEAAEENSDDDEHD